MTAAMFAGKSAATRVRTFGVLRRLALVSAIGLGSAACAYDVGEPEPETVGQASHELGAPGDSPGVEGPSADLGGTPGDPDGPTPDPWKSLDVSPGGGPTPDPWLQAVSKQASGTGAPQDPGSDPDPGGSGSGSGVIGQHH